MRAAALVGSHATRYSGPGQGARPVPPARDPFPEYAMSVLQRPQPRPGVLAIDAYVPGKSTAPGRRAGVQAVVERDAARPEPEGGRGLSRGRPSTARTIRTAPSTALREAIGRAFGLDPDRIVCGAGSDDLLNLIARRLSRRRRRGDLHHPRLPGLSDRHARLRRDAGRGGGEEPHRRRRRDPRGGDASAPRSSSSPIPTIRPAPMCRSTRSSACIARCRRTCCSCSTRPMPNMSAATTTRPASSSSPPPTTW